MRNKNKYCLKILGSLVFIGVIVGILKFLPKEQTETIMNSYQLNDNDNNEILTVTNETKRPYWQLYFEWVAVGCTIAVIWIWRGKLGITGILGVEGKDPVIQQQEPDDKITQFHELRTNNTSNINYESGIKNEKTETILESFLNNYKNNGFFYAMQFAKFAKIPVKQAEQFLYEKVNNGKLRVDANPIPIFSLSKSYENQVIDGVLNYISSSYIITKEVRFGQVNKIDFDACFETEKSLFFVDVRRNDAIINPEGDIHCIKRLSVCAKKFHKQNKFIVLAIGYKDESQKDKLVEYSKNFNYNYGEIKTLVIPIKIS